MPNGLILWIRTLTNGLYSLIKLILVTRCANVKLILLTEQYNVNKSPSSHEIRGARGTI